MRTTEFTTVKIESIALIEVKEFRTTRSVFKYHRNILAGLVVIFGFLLSTSNASIAGQWEIIVGGGASAPCGNDPVGCAKSSLTLNWPYPNNNYWQLVEWKECFAVFAAFECWAWVSIDKVWDNKGFTHLVCDTSAGELQIGYTCTKSENDPGSCRSTVDNPVDARLGAKYDSSIDYESATSAMKLVRSYSSSYGRYGLRSDMASRFGRVWRSNFDLALTFQNGAALIDVALPDGRERRFYLAGSDYIPRGFNRAALSWQDAPQVKERLRQVGSTYELTAPDSTIYDFDAGGNLTAVRYADGYTQTLTWSGGKNTLVTDSFGRTLAFAYGPNGYVSTVTLPDGSQIGYEYEAKADGTGVPVLHPEYALTKVTYPDATPGTTTDNPTFQYHYENTTFRYALTGKTDERGIRVRSWTYDGDGRVQTASLPGGLGAYTFAYDVPNGRTTVTNPLGKQTIYHYTQNVPGPSRLTRIEGVASSNCAAADTTYTYDANGHLASEVDGEGRKTIFVNDTRGNPTSITRGAP